MLDAPLPKNNKCKWLLDSEVLSLCLP